MTPLSSTTYRINFGDISLDTPNESTEAGITMSLYKWNGGAHQKVVMEKQSGYEGNVVRMKMQNSNMYLRATTDGERVVQSWDDDWKWNQMWRLLKLDDEIPTKDSSVAIHAGVRASASTYGARIYRKNGMLYVQFGDENGTSRNNNGAKPEPRAYDFKGRLLK
jgi:hypothetical protein